MRHARVDSFPLRPREKHGVVKAINKRCSKDFQAVVDGYCKLRVKLLAMTTFFFRSINALIIQEFRFFHIIHYFKQYRFQMFYFF